MKLILVKTNNASAFQIFPYSIMQVSKLSSIKKWLKTYFKLFHVLVYPSQTL